MAEYPTEKPWWIVQAHALSDPSSSEEEELLAELAVMLHQWPTTNPVAGRALRAASMELFAMAQQASTDRKPIID